MPPGKPLTGLDTPRRSVCAPGRSSLRRPCNGANDELSPLCVVSVPPPPPGEPQSEVACTGERRPLTPTNTALPGAAGGTVAAVRGAHDWSGVTGAFLDAFVAS